MKSFNPWLDAYRDRTKAIRALAEGIREMAVNTAALTQAMVDLKTAAGVASTALDDLAAKLAATSTSDPAAQAAIDDAVSQANSISAGLTAAAAKDDPAPVA